MAAVAAAQGLDDLGERDLLGKPVEAIAAVGASARAQHARADQGLEALGEGGLGQLEAARDAGQLEGLAGARGDDRERLKRVAQRLGQPDQIQIRSLDSVIVADLIPDGECFTLSP